MVPCHPPPHSQPIAWNAHHTASCTWIMPGSIWDRSTNATPAGGDTCVGRHERVLHRVHVHRPSVRMLGPLRRRARPEPAIERRRVVGGHRPVVVRAVVVDQTHATDGEPLLVQPLEHVDEPLRVPAVHDQLPLMGAPVEPVVREPEEPQVAQRNRAPGVPRASDHQVARGGIDDRHRSVERGQAPRTVLCRSRDGRRERCQEDEEREPATGRRDQVPQFDVNHACTRSDAALNSGSWNFCDACVIAAITSGGGA